MVELHGPEDYSPIDAAQVLTQLLNKRVNAVPVAESEWAGVFAGHGMPPVSVEAFVEMYRGFNRGLTVFEGRHETRRGKISLHAALAALLDVEH